MYTKPRDGLVADCHLERDDYWTGTSLIRTTFLAQRAGLFSSGTMSRNGPSAVSSGAPFLASARKITLLVKPESTSASANATRYPSDASTLIAVASALPRTASPAGRSTRRRSSPRETPWYVPSTL